ncbi:glycosyltransferase family 4 protein [Neobacillus sp. Marseille-QA0830]
MTKQNVKNFGILRLYCGISGQKGFYNLQELGLAKGLSKQGFNIYIFLLDSSLKERKEEIISENICIVYLPAKNIANHGFFDCSILSEYNINILQLQSDNQIFAPYIMKYCKRNNIHFYNYVGTIYSDSDNNLKRFIMNLFSRRNIRYFSKYPTFVKTPKVKKQLNDKGVRNIEVIPVGLDIDVIPQVLESKIIVRKRLGLPNEKKILVFVGRLEEYKQPMDIAELLHYLDDNYYLTIIGNGSLKDQLLFKIKKYGLIDRFKLIESIPNHEIHLYYKAADCFINLNRHEIFGMSILEAMYQGCPVIARHAPGPDYIIQDGVTGFLCDDYNAMANCLKDLNQNMGILSRERVIQQFNWDSISKKIVKRINIL